MGGHWTPDEDAQLHKLAPTSISNAVLAERIGRSWNAVKARMARLGIVRPRMGEYREYQCAELHKQGYSVEEIAERLGYGSLNSVRALISRYNVCNKKDESGYSWAYRNWKKAQEAARQQLETM